MLSHFQYFFCKRRMNRLGKVAICVAAVILLAVILLSALSRSFDDASLNTRSTMTEQEDEVTQIGPWHKPILTHSFTFQKQVSPKSKINVATIQSSEVDGAFNSSPGFEQIVELSKKLKLSEVEVVKALVTEYWETTNHGRLGIIYLYGIPTTAWFSSRAEDGKLNDTKYLYFRTWDEASDIHEANPIYAGYGDIGG